MNDLLDTTTAAKRMGVRPSHISRLCKAGRLPGTIKKNGCWQIPSTAHPRLSEAAVPDELAGISETKQQEALRRLGLLKELKKHTADIFRHGGTRDYAYESFADKQGVSRSSLYRWQKKYRQQGLAGLIDMRGGVYISKQQVTNEKIT